MSTTTNAGSQETVGEITLTGGLKQLAQYHEDATGTTVLTNPIENVKEEIPEVVKPGAEVDIGDGQMEMAEDITIEATEIAGLSREITGASSGFPDVPEEAYGNFSNTSVQNLFDDLLTAKAQETFAATFHGTVGEDEVKAAEESAKAFAHYATAAIVGFINNLTIEAQHTFSYSDDVFSSTSGAENATLVSAGNLAGLVFEGIKTGKALSQIDTVYTIKVKG